MSPLGVASCVLQLQEFFRAGLNEVKHDLIDDFVKKPIWRTTYFNLENI